MSDYLNTIVARTLGLASVVQPRLGSFFEPHSFAAINAGPLSVAGETASVDQSPGNTVSGVSVRTLMTQDEQQGLMTGKRKPRGIDRAVWNADEGESQEQPFDTMISRSPVGPAASLSNLRMEPWPHVSEPGEGPRRLRAQTHEPYEQQADSLPFTEGEANNNENSQRAGFRPRQKDAGHFDQSGALDSNRSERSEPAPAHKTHKLPGAIPVLQPNELPVTSLRRAFAEPAIAREAPPTISVTIGRVEVRAVFAPAAAARVSRGKQPAAMSLDDYLEKKDERHR